MGRTMQYVPVCQCGSRDIVPVDSGSTNQLYYCKECGVIKPLWKLDKEKAPDSGG